MDSCFAFLLDGELGMLVDDVTVRAPDGGVSSSVDPSCPVTAQLSFQGCTLGMALFTTISKATGCVGQITPLRKAGLTSYYPDLSVSERKGFVVKERWLISFWF